MNHAQKSLTELQQAGIPVEIDDRNVKLGTKIRDAVLTKTPYMFVIGEKEVEADAVSVRKYDVGDTGMFTLSEIIPTLLSEK